MYLKCTLCKENTSWLVASKLIKIFGMLKDTSQERPLVREFWQSRYYRLGSSVNNKNGNNIDDNHDQKWIMKLGDL